MGNYNNINNPTNHLGLKRSIKLLTEVTFKAFGRAKVYQIDNYDRLVVGIPCSLMLKDPLIRTQIHHQNLHSALAWEEASLEKNEKRIFYFNYSELSLDSIIQTRKQQNKFFPESDILRIARDILQVLVHLHKHGICMGGIEPSTIFHDKVTNSICMYDTSLILGEHAAYHKLAKYTTPEVLKALQEGSLEYLEKYKFQSDIFCVGLSLLEMCRFKDTSNLADRSYLKNQGNVLTKEIECITNQYSQKVIALIKGMLEINPNKRLSAAELLNMIDQQQIQPQPTVLQEQNNFNIPTKQVYLRSISPIMNENSQKQQLQTCGVLKIVSHLNPYPGIIQNLEQKILLQPQQPQGQQFYLSSNSRQTSPFSSNTSNHHRNNPQCFMHDQTLTPRSAQFSILSGQATCTQNNLVSAPFQTQKNMNNTDFMDAISPDNTSFIGKKSNNANQIISNRLSQLQQYINCQGFANQQSSSQNVSASPPRSLSPVYFISSNSNRSPSISSYPSKITHNITNTQILLSPQKVTLSPPRNISPIISYTPIIQGAAPASFKLDSFLKPIIPLQSQGQNKNTISIKLDQQILQKDKNPRTLNTPQQQQSQKKPLSLGLQNQSEQHKSNVNQNYPPYKSIIHSRIEQTLDLNQCQQYSFEQKQQDLKIEKSQYQQKHQFKQNVSPPSVSNNKNLNSSMLPQKKTFLLGSPLTLTERKNHFVTQPIPLLQNQTHFSNIPLQSSHQSNNNAQIKSQFNLQKGQITYQNKSCNSSPQSRPYFLVRDTSQHQQQTQKVSPCVSFGNNNNSSTRNSSFISPITQDQQVSFVSYFANQPFGIPISANCSPNKNITSMKRLVSPVVTSSNNNTPRTINLLGQQTQKITQFQSQMNNNINNFFVPAQLSYLPLSQPPQPPLFSITSLQENSIQNHHQSSRNSSASKPSTPRQEKGEYGASSSTVAAEQPSLNIPSNIPHPSVIQEESDQSAFEESLRAGTQVLQHNSKCTNSDYSKSNEGFFKYTFNCGEQSPFSNNKQSEPTINIPCSFQNEFNYPGNEIQNYSPQH